MLSYVRIFGAKNLNHISYNHEPIYKMAIISSNVLIYRIE
jgi:hypothetical protein